MAVQSGSCTRMTWLLLLGCGAGFEACYFHDYDFSAWKLHSSIAFVIGGIVGELNPFHGVPIMAKDSVLSDVPLLYVSDHDFQGSFSPGLTWAEEHNRAIVLRYQIVYQGSAPNVDTRSTIVKKRRSHHGKYPAPTYWNDSGSFIHHMIQFMTAVMAKSLLS